MTAADRADDQQGEFALDEAFVDSVLGADDATDDCFGGGDDPIPYQLPDQPDVGDLTPDQRELLVPLCADVESWVRDIYAPTFIRRITQTQRWCPSWWAHPEAVVRLETLWRTWEVARAAEHPDGMADWLRSALDLLNPVLLSPDGPFAGCTPDRHTDRPPMPLVPAPPGWWTDQPTNDPAGG